VKERRDLLNVENFEITEFITGRYEERAKHFLELQLTKIKPNCNMNTP